MNPNFEKVYKKAGQKLFIIGILFVACFFLFYVYARSNNLLFPLLDESRLSLRVACLIVGLELTILYFLPYIILLFFREIKRISFDYVDSLVYKNEQNTVLKIFKQIRQNSYTVMLFLAFIIIYVPYLEFLPLPFLLIGLLLINRSKEILQNY